MNEKPIAGPTSGLKPMRAILSPEQVVVLEPEVKSPLLRCPRCGQSYFARTSGSAKVRFYVCVDGTLHPQDTDAVKKVRVE